MLVKKLKNLLKKFDQHGAQVNFTYNCKTTYQTATGGVLTILSRLGIMAFFFVIVNSIVYKDKTITISSIGKSPTQDVQTYPLDLSNFDIGFSLYFTDNLPHLTEKLNYYRYYDIRIQYVYNLYLTDSNGTTTRVRQTTDIPLTNCSITRFANLSDEILSYGINQQGWYCPANISFNLMGQAQSINQTRIRLIVNQCKNSTANQNYCASQSEITTFANTARVQIATLNSYFNENEFQNDPIKRSLSVEIFTIATGLQQTIQRTLRRNQILTKDSWISSSFDNQEYVYYQDLSGTIKVANTVTDWIIFTYSCDGQENFTTRKVLSLADAAASAGGFASIILLISRLIAKIYAIPLYYSSLLRNIYQHEERSSKPDEDYEFFKKAEYSSRVQQFKEIFSKRQVLKINILKQKFIDVFCRCSNQLRNSKEQKLYKQGIYQLQKALDIRKILRMMQKFQTLERIVLKDYQRKVLNYSTRHMIRNSNKQSYNNKFELKRVSEAYIKKVVKNHNKPINKALIFEIFGYRKESFAPQNISSLSMNKKKETVNESKIQKLDILEESIFNDKSGTSRRLVNLNSPVERRNINKRKLKIDDRRFY